MHQSDDAAADIATIARETFEYGVVPWASRKYVEWVRAWARRHPRDPHGLVQLPGPIYKAYELRTYGDRLSRRDAERLGYPRVPGEAERARVRKELHEALGRCDWDQAHDLDAQLRDLQEQVAATRVTALRPRSALG
jgi:hypothetical protein